MHQYLVCFRSTAGSSLVSTPWLRFGQHCLPMPHVHQMAAEERRRRRADSCGRLCQRPTGRLFVWFPSVFAGRPKLQVGTIAFHAAHSAIGGASLCRVTATVWHVCFFGGCGTASEARAAA